MKVVKVTFHFDDGSTRYTADQSDLNYITSNLPKKWNGLKKTATIRDLHNKYYAMLRTLWKESKSGYTMSMFYESFKPFVFGHLRERPYLFTTGVPEASTKNLTAEGYSELIQSLKDIAHEMFLYKFD